MLKLLQWLYLSWSVCTSSGIFAGYWLPNRLVPLPMTWTKIIYRSSKSHSDFSIIWENLWGDPTTTTRLKSKQFIVENVEKYFALWEENDLKDFVFSWSRDGLPGELREHHRGHLLPVDVPRDQFPHRHQHVHCRHPGELQSSHRGCDGNCLTISSNPNLHKL